MGGHTMREGLTVGRSLSAAAIVRMGGVGCQQGLRAGSQPLFTEAGGAAGTRWGSRRIIFRLSPLSP